ncbi:MAG: lysine--tRNA ligase, partial [Candidatus Pacebacteria bacterium CG10_big_fil_rev_8_21_14_0_10_56_10]
LATDQGTPVQTAGRLMAVRAHGKLNFAHLQDHTGQAQLMFRQEQLAKKFELLSLIDAGDFLGVTGQMTTTKTGEVTIAVSDFELLGKTLRPIPTAWNAAERKEARFRRRYLDMLINPEVKRVLDARWLILKETRRYLQDRHGFVEVETPVFQPLYGGTNATPFVTHMNALDTEFYLRLAPELYLKRLVVGGYERIFEIARNFRNEGIDQAHQPEFTMIEWYQAYADYRQVMAVAEGLFKHLTNQLYGSSTLKVDGQEIDLAGSWRQLTMVEALRKYARLDFEALDEGSLRALLEQHQLRLIGEFTRGKAMFELFNKLAAPRIIQPTWVIDYPRDVSPLSRAHRHNPELAERFEGYIGGREIADGWSEITDPIDQRQIFENEQRRMRAGDTEAHPLDEDFLEAMEYGLPPLGGIGIGIDRMVMFLTNTWSIREVIAFPTLRPLPARPAEQTDGPSPSSSQSPSSSSSSPVSLPDRDQAEQLLEHHISNHQLRHHCRMVASAMAAYARELGENEELWYQAGLLHDLDWEAFPDQHPKKAVEEWLKDYPQELKNAVTAHAPERTGRQPQSELERYLFACDELSGFMQAVSLMRPGGFSDMKPKSVTKKLKDASFAANVSRDDISHGLELIGAEPAEHIGFLIKVFA